MEKVVVTSRAEDVRGLIDLGVADADTPVLHPAEAEPKHVAGKIVVGAVPVRIAVAAAEVWEPFRARTLSEQQMPLSADYAVPRYEGLGRWRVEEVHDERPASLIATRHRELEEWIRGMGLAEPDAPVLPHAQPDDVRGHVIAGHFPLRVAAAADRAIAVSLKLPRELVGKGDLSHDEMAPHIERVIRYVVVSAVDR